MTYFYSIILGIVQGITEFVPVSSSGHLVILHEWLDLRVGSDLAFDVALHAGTSVAIIIFFTKDIIHYFVSDRKVLWYVMISAVPAGIVGVVFESVIDYYLRSEWVVVSMLLAVSGLFFYVEHVSKQIKSIDDLGWKQALLIGCAQVLALIPGTSRSGITMSAGMLLGLDRVSAARFSFIMVIPILLGATLKKAYDLLGETLTREDWISIGLGTFFSCVVGIIAVRYLLVFFKRYTLRTFAWYRIALAVVVIASLLL